MVTLSADDGWPIRSTVTGGPSVVRSVIRKVNALPGSVGAAGFTYETAKTWDGAGGGAGGTGSGRTAKR
ncbi:hypothetical protein [Streptomyces sp. NPDC000410]|uniref:hypothetical protein n=1 Tax=Streptomyces sp. NPDC000410 TaxID=3154254 RepID=UPI00331D7E5B